MRAVLLPLLLTVLAATAPAAAQGPPSDGVEWSLGVGVLSAPRPYADADNETRLIPLLEVSTERFYFQGIRAGYRLVAGDRLGLDLRVRGQFAGFEEDDSPVLEGMEERRETIEAGLAAEWRLSRRWSVEVEMYGDVLDRHGGFQGAAEVGWSRVWDRGRVGLFPAVGVSWQDADVVDHLAGVRPDEVREGRPFYRGEATLSPYLGAGGFLRLSPRVRLVAFTQLERLADELTDSPIVDREWDYFGLVGITYRF